MALRIGAIVQARFSSTRLRGKVLRPLRGEPMVLHVVRALADVDRLDGVLVATSTDPSDDRLAAFLAECNVPCYRGPLDDVAARFEGALAYTGWDAFARISGDSPVLLPGVVDEAVRLFRERTPDLVSNVVKRTFPRGQSVEVLSADAFRTASAVVRSNVDREHVTPYFYAHADEYDIVSFEHTPNRGDVRLCIDTQDDFDRIEALMGQLTRALRTYSIEDLVAKLPATVEKAAPE